MAKTTIVNFAGGAKNLKKQQVPRRKKDLSDKIIMWEVDGAKNRNNFPQQLIQNVYNSPIGSSAMDIWHEFVEGDGFVQAGIEDIVVNNDPDGNTLGDLHAKTAADISLLWGFAWHIRYDNSGRKVAVTHVPFEEVRLGDMDENGNVKNIAYNPYFGVPADKRTVRTKYYYTYNPDPGHVVQEIKDHQAKMARGEVSEKYPGQIYWYSIQRPLARVYPQPFYYSAINWFIIDSKIQEFHERNLDNNFLLSVVINMFGDPDQPAGSDTEDNDGDKKDQGKTVGEVFNENLMEMFAGANKGGKAMVNWFQSENEKADIHEFPVQSNHELFLALQNLTTDQICIGTKVPPILLSIREGGKLGDVQEILNAIRVMQGRTRRMRNILQRKYKMIIGDMQLAQNVENFDVKNVNPFDILPQWVIQELTPTERREYINEHFPLEIDTEIVVSKPGEPVPVQDSPDVVVNENMKNLTGKQLQNIQRIVRKYSKDELTYEQASIMLKTGYAFNDDDVAIFLGPIVEEESEIELS